MFCKPAAKHHVACQRLDRAVLDVNHFRFKTALSVQSVINNKQSGVFQKLNKF